MEKHSNGMRVSFHHGHKQMRFLYWIQNFLATRGYCTQKKRKLKQMVGKNRKVYFNLKFHIFTFQSFTWIYDQFYSKKMKKLPQNIDQFLSPLMLAVWIMGDSHYTPFGIRIHCEHLSHNDVLRLQKVFMLKYGWKTTIQKKQNPSKTKTYESIYLCVSKRF